MATADPVMVFVNARRFILKNRETRFRAQFALDITRVCYLVGKQENESFPRFDFRGSRPSRSRTRSKTNRFFVTADVRSRHVAGHARRDHEPKAPASWTHSKRFAKFCDLEPGATAFGVRGACSRFCRGFTNGRMPWKFRLLMSAATNRGRFTRRANEQTGGSNQRWPQK